MSKEIRVSGTHHQGVEKKVVTVIFVQRYLIGTTSKDECNIYYYTTKRIAESDGRGKLEIPTATSQKQTNPFLF